MLPRIPGYIIEQPLAETAEATLYRGVESETNRRIAIKVVKRVDEDGTAHEASVLSAIPENRNIIELLDHGTCDGGAYVVMEYLPHGGLQEKLSEGMHLQALIKVVKDVARALDIVHSSGFVHCDIKPENILFRGNGTAVLADFGIAQPLNSSCKSVNGTVRGTPEYMSPEQAAGRHVDGRADFYSLGVLMYHALVGRLPYLADNPIELGIKHLQEPIPRLPTYLNNFQEVLDRCMAKRQEQRLSSGSVLVELLDAIRVNTPALASVIRTEPISTREIFEAGGELLATQRDPIRMERQNQRQNQARRVRAGLLVTLFLSAVGAGIFYGYQNKLISPQLVLSKLGLGEDPVVQAAWGEAQSLHQDPNQGLATIVAAYRRILVIEPDHIPAQQAVASLAKEWMDIIDEALLQGNLQTATTRLSEASAVFPNDVGWVQLSTRLQNRERAERILVSTEGLLTSHGLSDVPSATAAIQAYQEVLRLAPGHPQAEQALAEMAVHYANLATRAAADGQVNDAISLLERATAADSSLAMLDDVRLLISQATTTQATIDEILQQARRYRADNRLITPAGENAAELYHRVLATDPDNIIAGQALDELAAQITANADQLLAANQLVAVENLMNQAAAAGMSAEFVNSIRGRLDAQRTRQLEIAELLSKARQLMTVGLLTAPASDNAVTHLREVQQLDPGNATAELLLQECAQRLAAVAEEAFEFGFVQSAEQYLDLALTITPEVPEWVTLRDSWEGGE
ncbi:MAG: protein kinase [Pseudomonadota bacterium]